MPGALAGGLFAVSVLVLVAGLALLVFDAVMGMSPWSLGLPLSGLGAVGLVVFGRCLVLAVDREVMEGRGSV